MEETFITKIYSRGKEYTQKNIKNVSFKKEKIKENKVIMKT